MPKQKQSSADGIERRRLARLLARIASSGDRSAAQAVARGYADRLFGLAYRILSNCVGPGRSP